MKPIVIAACFLLSCASNQVNIDNLNQRNYQYITRVKSNYRFEFTLETDTTLNYKDISDVKKILGSTYEERTVSYLRNSLNMLFVLDSILYNHEDEPVKMVKWPYDSTDRYVFFLYIDHKWISVMNVLIKNTVQF